jgi:hypothetical protein
VRRAVPGRPLAAAQARDGDWLVGTREALHVVGTDPWALGWEQVHRADWDLETTTLTIEEVTPYGEPWRARSFVLPEPGGLVPLVRERVTASVVVQRRYAVRGRKGFLVVGRRNPAGGGDIAWSYEFDEGVDPEDPDVARAAEAALTEWRDAL